MCGRFYTDDDEAQYRAVLALLYQRNPEEAALLLRKTGEIFPTDHVPVLLPDGPQLLQWGFSRFDGKGRVINARSETVLEKPMFRAPLLAEAHEAQAGGVPRAGRCLIPASSYFEWETREGKKYKYRLRPKQDGLFTFAGVYRSEAGAKTPVFVILTAPAAKEISFIHDRMPLILPQEQRDDWLASGEQAARLLEQGAQEIVFEPAV
jgi:putative SOS response-associated peptidase YedK